ncbi:MAG: carbohydrate deacetylase [Planctomycetales bacterium]
MMATPAQGDPSPRRVVLHADDLGMNRAVNRGILAAFTDGLLTSTSILTNAPGCSEALRSWTDLLAMQRRQILPSSAARRRLGDDGLRPFDLGVHLNLTQGRPLTRKRFPQALLDARGRFPGAGGLLWRLLRVGREHRSAIQAELCAQIERVLDYGLAPTHLNGHQYVEMMPIVSEIIPELLEKYSIGSVRIACESSLARTTLIHRLQPAVWGLAHVKRHFARRFSHQIRSRLVRGIPPRAPDTFFGTAHAGRIDLRLMALFLDRSPAGLTEIGLHPAATPVEPEFHANGDGWADPLAHLRPGELEMLCAPRLCEMLEERRIQLSRLPGEVPTLRRLAAA